MGVCDITGKTTIMTIIQNPTPQTLTTSLIVTAPKEALPFLSAFSSPGSCNRPSSSNRELAPSSERLKEFASAVCRPPSEQKARFGSRVPMSFI